MTDLIHCKGCTEDFYNGNNNLGIKECWNRKSATMVERVFIHIDAVPPYKNPRIEIVPSCYMRSRHVAVERSRIGVDGYWAS